MIPSKKEIMKTTIEVTNAQQLKEILTLDDLRNVNCERRKRILSNESCAKIAQKEVNVYTTDKTKTQICCHYTSFQLRQMNAEKAIEIFNSDGSQKAKLVC